MKRIRGRAKLWVLVVLLPLIAMRVAGAEGREKRELTEPGRCPNSSRMQSLWKTKRWLPLLALIAAGALAAQSRPSAEVSRQAFLKQFAAAALDRTNHVVRYDGAYVRIAYPGGDVPAGTGVCTDEVIRAYRAVGIDLQKEVHEDIAANFSAYPAKWHRQGPDSNIDHRRVPNLMVFFSRKGETLPITNRAEDYAPGDLVTWDLGSGLTHIGMVVDRKTILTRRYMIVHNIGAGPKMEDVLFNWKITGHYRYFGPPAGHTANGGGARKTG